MKKLFVKDKQNRKRCFFFNKKYFLLKILIKNIFIFLLIKYNIFLFYKFFFKKSFFISINNRCNNSYNKKRFIKYSFYSRHIFLKLIQNGKVFGIQKLNYNK